MGALALALLLPLLGAWRARHEPLAADLAIGVATLFAALQLGPAFYNSEAVAFFWLLVGLAAQSAEKASGPAETAVHRASPWLAAALAVGLAGHALSWPALSIDSLWRRARWPMNIGLQPPQADGRWTAAEATMSIDVQAPAVILRWHAGDIAAASYRAEVSLYMDGQLVERSLALPGRNRESVLPLAPVAGVKRLSVRVVPPFVPAEHLGGDDRRSLGILVHSITPLEAPATAPRP
jgi:hypothetical protein